MICPLIGEGKHSEFTKRLASEFLALRKNDRAMKDVFKSESGCFVILKVLSHSQKFVKQLLFHRMMDTLMEDIVKLSKATHTHETMNFMRAYWNRANNNSTC